MRFWAICTLQLLVSHVVTSQTLTLTLSFNQAVFIHEQKVKAKIEIS